MKKGNKRENQSEPEDNPKEKKTPETNPTPLSYPFLPPAEALLGSLLPLSLGIVGTDISQCEAGVVVTCRYVPAVKVPNIGFPYGDRLVVLPV